MLVEVAKGVVLVEVAKGVVLVEVAEGVVLVEVAEDTPPSAWVSAGPIPRPAAGRNGRDRRGRG